MRIYISGPITGVDNYREKFDAFADIIRSKGHEVVNPCDMDNILSPATTTWEQYMIADLGLLRCCDAIFLMPGWKESRGAAVEYHEATRLRMLIYNSIEQIP